MAGRLLKRSMYAAHRDRAMSTLGATVYLKLPKYALTSSSSLEQLECPLFILRNAHTFPLARR